MEHAALRILRESASKVKCLVVGDLILDRYTWGDAERISPEAPVVVLRTTDREVRLGGAASVASLLRGWGAQVDLAGVCSDDPAGRTLRRLLSEAGISAELVLQADDRPTTEKERFVGRAGNRHAHQILRVDHESQGDLRPMLREQLWTKISDGLGEYDAVLISDYAKGVCGEDFLRRLLPAARQHQVPTVVDPPWLDDFSRYAGATLLKPNRKEAQTATGLSIHSPADAIRAGRLLARDIDAVVVTLDRDGLVVVGDSLEECISTRSRDVYDITGAGDVVTAMLGLCSAIDIPLRASARLANIAGGLEVERWGVTSIGLDELEAEILGDRGAVRATLSAQEKIVPIEAAVAWAGEQRRVGRRIVMTNGCFDLLHVGHVNSLEQARSLGDVLVVAVNSDRGVQSLKGADRPIVCERDRARMLAALSVVDLVLIFDDDTPHELLHRLQPDLLAKGGSTEKVVGREVVEAYGGEVRLLDLVDGLSTTQLVNQLKSCVGTE
jgi:D-beta-D-heptose 7-phosphate kinase/D-beta-D-heptose 1-phosphate adenosyltransferase